MAEFPTLGRHCGVDLCNQLDFLPIKCDSCSDTFCITHFSYDNHGCAGLHKKNVQVPVCPMCSQPVPCPKGSSIDALVDQHINNNCPATKKKRIFKNQCTKTGCKKRELVPFTCSTCRQNFCVSHRHEVDHDCAARASNMTPAARAALVRQQQGCSRQAQMDSDRALASALAESLGTNLSPEELDRRLAEQLQAEENGRRVGPRAGQGIADKCTVS
ncbi:unnamed protein product, partial [Mesorhabditis spiculigera]